MKEYVVVYPQELITSVLEESRKIQERIYSQTGSGIYFRVKTKDKLDNPRRLFFKGDGKIVELQVKPHLSLVHNIEFPEEKTNEFFEKIEETVKKYRPFYLEFDGVGNYNQDFTFFLKFRNNELLTNIRNEILLESKEYLTEEEYNQHTSVDFVPHVTVLYDDIDSEKVKKAQELLDVKKFENPILIDNIQIWEVSLAEQKPVKIIKL